MRYGNTDIGGTKHAHDMRIPPTALTGSTRHITKQLQDRSRDDVHESGHASPRHTMTILRTRQSRTHTNRTNANKKQSTSGPNQEGDRLTRAKNNRTKDKNRETRLAEKITSMTKRDIKKARKIK